VTLALLGPWDFVIIVGVLVLVFGTRPFARALRSLKSGGRELRRGVRGGDDKLPPPPETS
jgi:Sec-independent protein translocase protein TatA